MATVSRWRIFKAAHLGPVVRGPPALLRQWGKRRDVMHSLITKVRMHPRVKYDFSRAWEQFLVGIRTQVLWVKVQRLLQ